MSNDGLMWRKSIELVTLVLIVVGALNWGLVGAFDFNLVSWLAKHTFQGVEPAVYVLVGVSALVHLFSRDYFLPFLGDSAYPCGALETKTPRGADTSVTIRTEPNVNVIYWAAEVNEQVQANPWVAYDEYANAGVTRSDDLGNAVLRFRKPAGYKVSKFGMVSTELDPHVHYRVCKHPGMMGRVETVFL